MMKFKYLGVVNASIFLISYDITIKASILTNI